MPGNNSLEAINSYAAFFKEATFGTYPASAATGATFMEFTSCDFKTEIEKRKLDTIGRRGFVKQVPLAKTVAGAIESHLHPHESVLPLAAALGGGIVSTVVTGTSAYIHTLSAAYQNFTTPSSLSFNVSKGGSVFGYKGGRVNTITITAEQGEPVTASYEMVFQDNAVASDGVADIASNFAISAALPFTFVQGTFRYGATEAGADTTTAVEPIQSFELTINNNVVSDGDARQLGTDTPGVLPPTRRDVEFTTSQRFDTTTSRDRMLANTSGSVILKFTGDSIAATSGSYECEIRLPKVYVAAADAEIGGPDELLKAEISWNVVMDDPNTTTGRDIAITFRNNVASY
jgi:hypothetical protein